MTQQSSSSELLLSPRGINDRVKRRTDPDYSWVKDTYRRMDDRLPLY